MISGNFWVKNGPVLLTIFLTIYLTFSQNHPLILVFIGICAYSTFHGKQQDHEWLYDRFYYKIHADKEVYDLQSSSQVDKSTNNNNNLNGTVVQNENQLENQPEHQPENQPENKPETSSSKPGEVKESMGNYPRPISQTNQGSRYPWPVMPKTTPYADFTPTAIWPENEMGDIKLPTPTYEKGPNYTRGGFSVNFMFRRKF